MPSDQNIHSYRSSTGQSSRSAASKQTPANGSGSGSGDRSPLGQLDFLKGLNKKAAKGMTIHREQSLLWTNSSRGWPNPETQRTEARQQASSHATARVESPSSKVCRPQFQT
ncbi:hypothetical protein LTR48_000008 [Friedmanniomyces endolithicus]|nr:hypothetical protein LTR33_019260 [Friedmanniomyces endolithicus]KAK1089722.1 hypothetical protein LTR48_000008 [Friedmanniomyces endolithicus]